MDFIIYCILKIWCSPHIHISINIRIFSFWSATNQHIKIIFFAIQKYNVVIVLNPFIDRGLIGRRCFRLEFICKKPQRKTRVLLVFYIVMIIFFMCQSQSQLKRNIIYYDLFSIIVLYSFFICEYVEKYGFTIIQNNKNRKYTNATTPRFN